MPSDAPLSKFLPPKPLPYTASPIRLLWNDVLLFLAITLTWSPWAGLPSIVLPFYPFGCGKYDELYPSPQNLWSLAVQTVLLVVQAIFLIALIPSALIGVPIPFHAAFYLGTIGAYVLLNMAFTNLALNGRKKRFISNPEITKDWPDFPSEHWVFINGVAAGNHWMQSNLDRLALTFRRPIHGIHNQTRGILFDVIECVIQRSLGYDTNDIREAYKKLVEVLMDDNIKKVVLVLHSQGGIEGGMVLDWLYATSLDKVYKLEVYTFGNAANHFNSPMRYSKPVDSHVSPNNDRSIKYIEHYANTGDYVSRFGILHFRPHSNVSHAPGAGESRGDGDGNGNGNGNGKAREDTKDQESKQQPENLYVGRLFTREGSGHQFNGNYLDNIFPMNKDLTRVLDNNPYMDSYIDWRLLARCDTVAVVEAPEEAVEEEDDEEEDLIAGYARAFRDGGLRVKELSRLWKYRNGGRPSGEEGVEKGVREAVEEEL